jgi:hypothetical protein
MKLADTITTSIRKLSEIIVKIRANKTVNTLLIVFSYLYPIILTAISWRDIGELDLSNFSNPFLISLFYGFVSLILQAVNWNFIVSRNFSKPINNIEIYFKTLLMRRLPGGFWHWHGRLNLYNNSNTQPTKKISKANAVEFLGLIFSGVITYLLVEYMFLGLVVLIFSYLILFFLTQEKHKVLSNYLIPFFLILSYIVCWLMGGYILHTLFNYVSPGQMLGLSTAISFWVITGTIGTIFFFMPITGLFRELTLTALLSNYLDFSKIILLSLLIRLTLYICDVILSLVVLGIASINKKRPTETM